MMSDVQAAAERMKTQWDLMSKSFDENANPHMAYVEDLSILADWALMLLSTELVNSEWLQKHWDTYAQPGYSRCLFVRAPVNSLMLDCRNDKIWLGSRQLSMNQGQFTAFMFSLDQFPKS